MPAAKGKRTIGAELDEAFIQELDDRAKAEGRSRAELIIRALRFFLDNTKVQPDAPPEIVPKPRKK